MNTSELKKFAQSARRQLREQVAGRLEQVLHSDSVELREKESALKDLREQIAKTSKKSVIDKVAYTWFNRFCALRFMDVNRYTRMGVVSPAEGLSQPEILQEAKHGYIDDDLKPLVNAKGVFDLLNNQRPSADPQGEAYRLLLVAACNFYNTTMPFLFEKIADYTELLMPLDLLSEHSVLHDLRQALTPEACQDVEVIGWLYQYYISERKDEVFAALKENQKIEAEDIPAATQLFTPHWIVRYLVENSLGRLWMLNHPDSKLVEQMEYYIQPVQEETGFLKISSPEDIKLNDPACGSGHMLTYAFDLFYFMYEEAGYPTADIPKLILEKNLYGIEIDPRAGALAAFALTMKARFKDKRFFSREVQPNICVLENVTFTDQELEEYMNTVGRDLFTEPLLETLRQFEQSNIFGSLIRPVLTDSSYVREILETRNIGSNLFLYSVQKRVSKVLKQAEILSRHYHVVVANPPYMGSGGMDDDLKEFLADFYPDVKYDLFSAFIVRNLDFSYSGGQLGYMSPFVWMFISSYEKLRKYIIEEKTITTLIQLEYSGFDGATVPICTFTLENTKKKIFLGSYIRLSDFRGHLNQAPKTLEAIKNPDCGWLFKADANEFSAIPGMPIAYWISPKIRETFRNSNVTVFDWTISDGQTKTGDNDKFLKQIWEVSNKHIGQNSQKWRLHPKGGAYRKWYGNVDWVIDWSESARIHYRKDRVARILPEYLWNKPGISWTLITSSDISFRLLEAGQIFNLAAPSLFFDDETNISVSLGLLNSNFIGYILKVINPTMNMNVGEVRCLPISEKLIKNKEKLIAIVDTCIDIANKDWNSLETSFGFEKMPLLQESFCKPLLYETYSLLRLYWGDLVSQMNKLEEENNNIINESYNLQDEFPYKIEIEKVTLACNPNYRYGSKKSDKELEIILCADTIKEFISYAVGCMFGRYTLDKPGLVLANQGESLQDYLRQVPEPSFMPDEDNVIPVLEGEWFSDDIVERFKAFLRVTFGDEHYDENLAFIEEAIGRDIRGYFLKDFYKEHIQMYKKRPIYWMFSSPKGSFNVLIYMHRYQLDTISIILNNYLRQYREKLTAHKSYQEAIGRNPGAGQSEKTKALKEIERVNKVLVELKEYEDEILYPLATQQIKIDLDDGVKVNYAKFGKALAKIPGL